MNKSAKQGRPNIVASGVDEGNEVEAVDVSRDALCGLGASERHLSSPPRPGSLVLYRLPTLEPTYAQSLPRDVAGFSSISAAKAPLYSSANTC